MSVLSIFLNIAILFIFLNIDIIYISKCRFMSTISLKLYLKLFNVGATYLNDHLFRCNGRFRHWSFFILFRVVVQVVVVGVLEIGALGSRGPGHSTGAAQRSHFQLR